MSHLLPDRMNLTSCKKSICLFGFVVDHPDLPVPYIFGTRLPVANISGNDRPLVPNR